MCLVRYCLLNCLNWCRRFCQCEDSDDEVMEPTNTQLRRQAGIRHQLRISDQEAIQMQPQIRVQKEAGEPRGNRGRLEESLELSMLHPPHNPFRRGERQLVRIPAPSSRMAQVGRQLSEAEEGVF